VTMVDLCQTLLRLALKKQLLRLYPRHHNLYMALALLCLCPLSSNYKRKEEVLERMEESSALNWRRHWPNEAEPMLGACLSRPSLLRSPENLRFVCGGGRCLRHYQTMVP
jgi:hypothetical protein